MSDPRVTGLRSVELAVQDVKAAQKFYEDCWGLELAVQDGSTAYMRCTGSEHHAVALHEAPEKKLIRVNLSADDKESVDGLYEKAKGIGVSVDAPVDLSGPAGGYGFVFRDLNDREYCISTGLKEHAAKEKAADKPFKLSHVVLNSPDRIAQSSQFVDVLGFKLSDRTGFMDFVRCSTDHHAIAYTSIENTNLNHCAFEMPSHDALMFGSGRMKRSGFPVEWGVGRHGPGNNIFAYFIDPTGYVIEYTAEVQQVDDSYKTGMPEDWERPPELKGDNWGFAEAASDRMRAATTG